MTFWSILGVIFAGAGLITPFLANIRRPARKSLEYVITRNQHLLNVPHGVSVTVSVEGRRVAQAFVTVLRIANTGAENFPARSWETPLMVRLVGSSVISAHQIAARPEGLRVGGMSMKGDTVEVLPFLFNSGDLFELQIVSEGAVPDSRVSVRIPGLRHVPRRQPIYNLGNGLDGALDLSNKIVYSIFFAMLPGMVAFSAFGPLTLSSGEPIPSTTRTSLVLVTVGMLGLYVAFLRWATVRNRRWRPNERL